MKEIIFVVLLAGGLLVPAGIAKQWWLFGVFMVFFACFGLVEWLSIKLTDKSVSQHFWAYSGKNKTMGWIVLAGMLIGWLSLLWHLGAKLL